MDANASRVASSAHPEHPSVHNSQNAELGSDLLGEENEMDEDLTGSSNEASKDSGQFDQLDDDTHAAENSTRADFVGALSSGPAGR